MRPWNTKILSTVPICCLKPC